MKKPKLFYGYWIVAVALLCMFISAGAVVYSFPLFYKPLAAEFEWSRSTISIAFTIHFVIQALTLPFVGKIIDHYGARKVIALGAVISGFGFLWLAFMQDLWSFYGGYAVIGLGMAAMGMVPATRTVSNWFTKRRGLALGIMSAGLGIGAAVVAPVFGAYLIPNFGWRASYLALAILTWVLIIPTALLVIKERPADMGLYADGAEAPEVVVEASLSSQVSKGWTLSSGLKTLTFWLIVLAFTFASSSHIAAIQHQVNHLTDIGFPMTTAAIALGVVGLGSGIGKIFFGWLCDRMPVKHAAAISFALQLAAIIVLINVKSISPLAMIWLYASLLGLGVGGWLPTMSMLISRNFGLSAYGAIFGAVNLVPMLGCALSPLVAAQMFDTMQTYFWVFVVFIVLFTVAIFLVLQVRRPKVG